MPWKQMTLDPTKTKRGSIIGGSTEIEKKTEPLREGVYKCALCGGTGKSRGGSNCQSCRGRGVHQIEGTVIRCAFCRGTGRPSRGVDLTCYVCKGSGWVKIEEPIEVCPACRGRGADPSTKLPCIVCKGKGHVTIKE